jgi:hypothetical protein
VAAPIGMRDAFAGAGDDEVARERQHLMTTFNQGRLCVAGCRGGKWNLGRRRG